MLNLKKLVPSATNPRKSVSKSDLRDLADSIKAQGILNPLLVRKVKGNGHFEIIAGWRRFQAAEILGLKSVPVIVKDADDDKVVEIQLVENLQRADVDPLEEAEGFKRLMKGGMAIKEVAERVGKSRTWVTDRLVLANLISELKGAYKRGEMRLATASILGRLNPEQQKDAYAARLYANNADWVKEQVQRRYFTFLKDAPFDLEDATLNETASACAKCEKRSTKNADLFGTFGKEDMCLDYGCLAGKVDVHLKRKEDELARKGAVVRISTNGSAESKDVLHRAYDPKDKGWFDLHKGGEAVTALVVDARELKEVGKVMKVCLTPPSRHATTVQGEKQRQDGIDKRKELELTKRTRRLMFKKLWEMRSVPKKTVIEKFFVLLMHALQNLPSDNQKAIIRALDIPIVETTSRHGVIKDHHKSIAVWMSEFENDDLYHLGMLLAVSGDLMVNEFTRNGDQLEVLTKLYGIDAKAVRKELADGDARAKAEKVVERKAERESKK